MATHMPVTENTLIAIRIAVHDSTKKLKLPLKDLGADKLIPKVTDAYLRGERRRLANRDTTQLRHLLQIEEAQTVIFERYSDSANGYVILDPTNPTVFKTLVRAAKAKLKLRLRANVSLSSKDQENTESKRESAEDVIPKLSGSSTSMRAAGRPVVVPIRGSTAFDQRSVGPGIFQFREPVSTEKKPEVGETDEAPVPHPFVASSKGKLVCSMPVAQMLTSPDFFGELAAHGKEHELALRAKEAPRAPTWSVYCNECDIAMNNIHFHCSLCEDGDYDLCQSCVANGKLCRGEGHWLIKRSIVDGNIVASTTERLPPKTRTQPVPAQTIPAVDEKTDNVGAERDMPGAFTDDARTLAEEPEGTFRTCNNCIIGLPDHEFVTCGVCDDFDLCRRCYVADKHGHHPAHHFAPAAPAAKLSPVEEALLAAGRNIRHNAICDGCEKVRICNSVAVVKTNN